MMAAWTRDQYIQAGKLLDALATLASGKNPDGTDFALPFDQGTPATDANAWPVKLPPDARSGALSSGTWTLAAGVVESIAVPAWARGFRLRPTADIRFAIAEDPVAAGAEVLTVGNTAIASEFEVRLLDSPVPATVRLLATGATTVVVDFF